jgi:hypothetical protein
VNVPNQLPFLWRFSLLLCAWFCTALVATGFHPAVLLQPCGPLAAFWFPLGLSGFFDSDLEHSSGGFYGWLTLGWSAYTALCVAALCQPRARRYLLVYCALCALLILNMVGCRIMPPFQIHPF